MTVSKRLPRRGVTMMSERTLVAAIRRFTEPRYGVSTDVAGPEEVFDTLDEARRRVLALTVERMLGAHDLNPAYDLNFGYGGTSIDAFAHWVVDHLDQIIVARASIRKIEP